MKDILDEIEFKCDAADDALQYYWAQLETVLNGDVMERLGDALEAIKDAKALAEDGLDKLKDSKD